MSVGLTLGQTVIIQHKFDPGDWLRLVDKYKVTSTFSAPPLIRLVCALPAEVKARYDRSSMRIMLANAAPWSFALKQAYLADFPPDSLWEVYGSTELGINCVLEPRDQLRKPGSCGGRARCRDPPARRRRHRGHRTGPSTPASCTSFRRGLQRVLQAARELPGRHARRLPHRGRHRLPGRGRLLLHLRPQERHDHLRRHEHLPRRDRGCPGTASGHLRRRGLRDPSEQWGEQVHATVVLAPGRRCRRPV